MTFMIPFSSKAFMNCLFYAQFSLEKEEHIQDQIN